MASPAPSAWRAGAWSALGVGPDTPVFAVRSLPGGEALIAAYFNGNGTAFGVSAARWDGTAWRLHPEQLRVNGGVTNAYALLPLPDGGALFGGTISYNGSVATPGVARLSGAAPGGQWSSLASGLDGAVNAVLALPGGGAIVGGEFRQAGAVPALRVARWTGGVFEALGAGLDATVSALARLPDGRIVVGGAFSQSGGGAALKVAVWDGAAWTTLGAGFDGTVWDLTVSPDGTLYASGVFTHSGATTVNHVARWDGAGGPSGQGAWAALGDGINGNVNSVVFVEGVGLVAGGSFTQAGGQSATNIARWDGTAWWPMGAGLNNSVYAVAALRSGGLIAGGLFTASGAAPMNRVAVWDGSAWAAMGAGVPDPAGAVWAVSQTHDGRPLVGGAFSIAGGAPGDRLAEWDGAAWRSVVPGIDRGVGSLAVLSDGTIALGGQFTTVGGGVSASFARLERSCSCGAADVGVAGGARGHDGALDNNDFVAFISAFFAPDPAADLGQGGGLPGPDGVYDNNDFVVFIDLFFAGC